MVDRTNGNDRSGPPQPMKGMIPDFAQMPGSGQPDSLVVVLWRHSWIIIGCVVLALIGEGSSTWPRPPPFLPAPPGSM